MKRLPQRLSLVSQTAAILREQIATGGWSKSIPGERDLSAQLHVSRPTIRAALDLLRSEGLLAVSHGRRREIRRLPKKVNLSVVTRRVALLTPIPLHQMPPFVMFWIDELREHLALDGFELDVQITVVAGLEKPRGSLEKLTTETPAAVWLLFLSTEPMQRWFAEQNLPCVITGSCFPGLNLPSIDVDSHAVCRHAANLLFSKGHRRIALLLPDGGTAGDRASEAGFLEAAEKNKSLNAAIVHHDGSTENVRRKIDRLVGGLHPVTGLLVARSAHALTAVTHLQQNGLRLPQDISLISRDNDPFLDFVVPRVSRYACNPIRFARRLSHMVLQLAKEGSIPRRQILMMPELIKGETL